MISIPNFNLDKSTMAFESDDALVEESNKKGGNRFEEGHYELKVIKAYLNGAANDTTWHKVVVELGSGVEGDERTIRAYPMIPTTLNTKYQKPGGKPTLFVFTKLFAPFFSSIGETVVQSNLKSIISKYTKNISPIKIKKFEDGVETEVEVPQLDDLVGKVVEVDIGFEGNYIKRVGDTDEFGVYTKAGKLVEVEGKELKDISYQDAEALATENNLTISRLSVLKFYARKVAEVDAFDEL